MCKPVTSMEEIIEAIKEGVRSANLPIRDTDEEVPLLKQEKSSQSSYLFPFFLLFFQGEGIGVQCPLFLCR